MTPLQQLNHDIEKKLDALLWEQRLAAYVREQKAMGLWADRPGQSYEGECLPVQFERPVDEHLLP